MDSEKLVAKNTRTGEKLLQVGKDLINGVLAVIVGPDNKRSEELAMAGILARDHDWVWLAA